MKHKQIWLLIAILLAYLAPPAFVLAEEEGEPTNFVEVGGAGMTVEQLKARYIGTGSADQSKYEFMTVE